MFIPQVHLFSKVVFSPLTISTTNWKGTHDDLTDTPDLPRKGKINKESDPFKARHTTLLGGGLGGGSGDKPKGKEIREERRKCSL